MESKKNKLLLMQALRGLAAVIVLLHHEALSLANPNIRITNKVLNVGWFGVDIFFVLSGFIIFYSNFSNIGVKHKTKEYFYRRLIRIYPVYWIVTLFAILLYKSAKNNFKLELGYAIKSFLLIPQANKPIVTVGWTLTYELFFYLMFGLLIYLNLKKSIPIFVIWIIGIMLNSFNLINLGNGVIFVFVRIKI